MCTRGRYNSRLINQSTLVDISEIAKKIVYNFKIYMLLKFFLFHLLSLFLKYDVVKPCVITLQETYTHIRGYAKTRVSKIDGVNKFRGITKS
jgi:hypothetical protein